VVALAQAPVIDFAAPAQPKPGLWGSNLWWTDQDAALWQSRWSELSLNTVRVFVPQVVVEPVNDNDEPAVINPAGFLFDTPIADPALDGRTLTLRKELQAVKASGATVILYVPYLAPWLSRAPNYTSYTSPMPPADLAEYRELVTAILRLAVKDIGIPAGRVMWEATNEPDLQCGQDADAPCFWVDHRAQDIADVVRVTHEAIVSIDPRIRLVGLAECCGTGNVRELMTRPEGALVDALSYHYYSRDGYDAGIPLGRMNELRGYGKPLLLDEYGTYDYAGDSYDNAMWHSWLLGVLWRNNIAPVQYPVSEYAPLPETYSDMGLFEDWRAGWKQKPVYWVYRNFYNNVASKQLIYAASIGQMDGLAVRGSRYLVFWITNRGDAMTLPLSVIHLPVSGNLRLLVTDNIRKTATARMINPTGFSVTVPSRSSMTYTLSW
jgi:hypothetical protein